VQTDCILWSGRIGNHRYGVVDVGGRSVLAHRQAWEDANGPIPVGLFVLHRCDNPPCVNPEHLFLGTHQDNMADMKAKGRGANGNTAKTHCKYGHPYDELRPDGRRRCRRCSGMPAGEPLDRLTSMN
jgi:hypothetical protein